LGKRRTAGDAGEYYGKAVQVWHGFSRIEVEEPA
jgi:hypothetical protein